MYRNQDITQPDALKEILELRPEGARRSSEKPSDLYNRMKGALIGRFAGCVLGIPVELYSVARMQALALDCGMNYPPTPFGPGRTVRKKSIIRSIKEPIICSRT